MKINLSTLMNKLRPYDPELYLSNDNGELLSDVKIIEKNQEKFEANCLYIGMLSDVQRLIFKDDTIDAFYAEDSDSIGKYAKAANLNLLTLRKNISLTSLSNELLDYFSKSQEDAKKLSNLLDAFTHPKDISHILDIGYEVIGNPISLIDTSFKLLAYTKNIETDDPRWNELVETGYFHSESVFSFKKERFIEKVVKSKSPVLFLANKLRDKKEFEEVDEVYVIGQPLKRSLIVSNVMIGDKTVAYLSVMEYNKDFQSCDIKTVGILCSAISSEMQKNNFFTKTRGMMYEYFIADLLNGSITDTMVVEERIKYLEWKLKRNFCVIVISTKQSDRENTPFNYIRIMFESIIVDSKSIEYDDHIVLVVNNNRENIIRESELYSLTELFTKHNLFGGISRCFTKIIDIKKHYSQALTAIKIGYRIDKQALLYNYENLVIFEMFDVCSTQKDLKDLCHPSLISLIEYDTKYKTNFVQTLYAYIENDKSQATTAKALNIHRNTISYRMRKIDEIMKVDFNDTMLVLRLYLSFKILDYINLDNTETDLTSD